jgi:hypothetical protein
LAVLFRRRRQASQRIAIVAALVFTYLASVAPAAATIIYCIGDGHSGFERVSGGERGCASCCHELPEAPAHDEHEAEPSECTDIALSSEQALRAGACADRHDFASVAPLGLPMRMYDHAALQGARRDLRAEAPPGAATSELRRSVVLLI